MPGEEPLERLRRICLDLPEATEKPFGGHTAPTWRVRDKIFAMSGGEEHDGEELSLWCKAPPGAQEALVGGDPDRYFVPPYVGHNGWVGVRINGIVDWGVVAGLITDGYRMTAPKRLLAVLDIHQRKLAERRRVNMTTNYMPEGYHTVTPYLVVPGAGELIDFLEEAFQGQEKERHLKPDGAIVHAEVRIGDSIVMLSDATPEFQPTRSSIHLYLEDVDAAYKRAVEAGGSSLREPQDQFYGDRSAGVADRFGNQWWLATHVEDVSAEEMERRQAAMAQS